MEIGIVGLPNAGKSTIFNVLTKSNVLVANYPFSTIEPNVGIVSVADNRLDFLYNIFKPKKDKPTYATIKFFDIAGLVKGASKGEGLGNQFLSHIKQVDAIAHIVRVFHDQNVSHTTKNINPVSDIEIINTELILSDIDVLNRNIEKIEKLAKQKDKKSEKKYQVLSKIKDALERGSLINMLNLSDEEYEEIKDFNFLTAKPVLYVFNVGEEDISGFTDKYKDVIKYVETKNSKYSIISARIEFDLMSLSIEEKEQYMKEAGIKYTGFEDFIKKSYELLNLITFFTVNENECRAWPVREGITAVKAAGKIHTDMEKGFIRAEVINFEDFKKYGSEQAVRESGKLRLEGRDYIVKDGDIINIKFNI
jgi:GTP-binding protein YchF